MDIQVQMFDALMEKPRFVRRLLGKLDGNPPLVVSAAAGHLEGLEGEHGTGCVHWLTAH